MKTWRLMGAGLLMSVGIHGNALAAPVMLACSYQINGKTVAPVLSVDEDANRVQVRFADESKWRDERLVRFTPETLTVDMWTIDRRSLALTLAGPNGERAFGKCAVMAATERAF